MNPPVTIDQINIIHIKPLQRSLSSFDNMFPRQTLVVRTRSTPKDLGGNDDIRPFPTQLPNSLTHDLLSSTIGINLGVVEKVNPVVFTTLEKRLGFFNIELVTETDPCSVGQLAHFQARSAQILVLHLFWVVAGKKKKKIVEKCG